MIPIIIIASVLGTLLLFRDDLQHLSDKHRNILLGISSTVVAVCFHIAMMPIYYALFG